MRRKAKKGVGQARDAEFGITILEAVFEEMMTNNHTLTPAKFCVAQK